MSLKQKTLKGLSWSSAAQVLRQASQFVITIILARVLSPNDFGAMIGTQTFFFAFITVVFLAILYYGILDYL